MDSYIKVVIENQLPVKSDQIHGSVTVYLIKQKCEGRFSSELRFTKFQQPHDIKKC